MEKDINKIKKIINDLENRLNRIENLFKDDKNKKLFERLSRQRETIKERLKFYSKYLN